MDKEETAGNEKASILPLKPTLDASVLRMLGWVLYEEDLAGGCYWIPPMREDSEPALASCRPL